MHTGLETPRSCTTVLNTQIRESGGKRDMRVKKSYISPILIFHNSELPESNLVFYSHNLATYRFAEPCVQES